MPQRRQLTDRRIKTDEQGLYQIVDTRRRFQIAQVGHQPKAEGTGRQEQIMP